MIGPLIDHIRLKFYNPDFIFRVVNMNYFLIVVFNVLFWLCFCIYDRVIL